MRRDSPLIEWLLRGLEQQLDALVERIAFALLGPATVIPTLLRGNDDLPTVTMHNVFAGHAFDCRQRGSRPPS